MTQRVGILVPTLGTRPFFLEECLRSIKLAGDAHVSLVAPGSFDASSLTAERLVDSVVVDEGAGLAIAINKGIQNLPANVQYVNWLGDDDLLLPDSITTCQKVLESNDSVVLVFGGCDYVDASGKYIWRNKSGRWAIPLMRFGPDLVPQPGALFRRDAFEKVGGLNSKYRWAFDFDLFIKLSQHGKLKFLNVILAKFRWHPDSLSVGQRRMSVQEASAVRMAHLPPNIRTLAHLWEIPIQMATLIAGTRLTAKANSGARQE